MTRRGETAAFLSALTGATLWGLSGTASQFLFEAGVHPEWLTTVRLLGAGLLLVLLLRPPLPRRRPAAFVGFSVLGLAGVQFAYLTTISLTNAPTATFLQYLGLPLIALYDTLVARRPLTPRLGAAVGLALIGTLLLVLPRGGFSVTGAGIVAGLLSACVMAFYTLASVPFVTKDGARATIAWGFLVGGAAASFVAPPWRLPPLTPEGWLALAFVVVVGTLLAFYLFLRSLGSISPTQAGVAAAVEPLVAAVAARLLLGVELHLLQYLGGAVIVLAVLLLEAQAARDSASARLWHEADGRPPPAAGDTELVYRVSAEEER
jgi:drug/metabolite transporter (DMT)-like permease